MAEPLKNVYNETFLRSFAERVRRCWPPFDAEAFLRRVMDEDWDDLALKGRMRKITESLGRYLPSRYEEALDVLESIAESCSGFPYLFFPDFVERYGLAHWDRSIRALERFTRLSSSEFAVRPFILRDPERMMGQMLAWSGHPDEHVRRLASEGCRPRLPWADALPMLKRDPSPILPILERLKEDPSEYVRKSVANNLNDISKDHPELVIRLARRWLSSGHPHTAWIVRHACRGLIRAANPEALAMFDLAPLSGIEVVSFTCAPQRVKIGESAEIGYRLQAPAGPPVKLRIELAVYYPRPSGRSYRKLFKLSERVAEGGAVLSGARRHSFADLSTRRHYPGAHRLALSVNGQELAETVLELIDGEGERRT